MKTLIKNLSACLNVASTPRRACLGVASKRSRAIRALIAGLGLILAVRATAQTLSNLCTFPDYNVGLPTAGLVLSGNILYGTVQGGGGSPGTGAVFAANTNGTGYTNIYIFTATSGSGGFGLGTNGDGAYPNAPLVLSGNTLYGTALAGGRSGYGTVFAVSTLGTDFTILHTFTNGIDGEVPSACGMILSGDTLYGTGSGGGTSGHGMVFAVNTDGTGFTNVYSFAGGTNGYSPVGGLILSGNTLYGALEHGGTSGNGMVFGVNTDGTGFTNLHSFAASAYNNTVSSVTNTDGISPQAGLILSGGTLYGTAPAGGTSGNGTVFAVNTNGTGFTVLHSFTEPVSYTNSDGAYPTGVLLLSGSILYGTAEYGGPYTNEDGDGAGTVFAVETNGTGFTKIYDFNGVSDGSQPSAGLILFDNVLYGTATYGGIEGYGSVFALSLPPSFDTVPLITWSPSPIIYGTALSSSLLNATANVPGGFAYSLTNGTVLTAGAHSLSVIFNPIDTLYYNSVTDTVILVVLPAPVLTNLHSFAAISHTAPYGNIDGNGSQAGLILSGGTLYGTANAGGSSDNGTVFALNTNGTDFTNVYIFSGGSGGSAPTASLILSGDTLYGTTKGGGSGGSGMVFDINTNGTAFSNVYSFTALSQTRSGNFNSDGAQPEAGLILSSDILYGTTKGGGSGGVGTVFGVNTDGTGFTNLHTFPAGAYIDGANPQAGLVLSGNTLYGTASEGGTNGWGTVFAVNTDGTGFTVLHNFDNSDGNEPLAGLILSGSTLYGTTSEGGSSGNGTVFAINIDGTGFTTLCSFAGGSSGTSPLGGLVLSGNTLYGTTTYGGRSGSGTVFAVNTDGAGVTILYSFSATVYDPSALGSTNSDGAAPYGSLILSGNTLYGTTEGGGSGGEGTVFALSLPVPIVTMPSITWNPAPITYGTALSSDQLNAAANVPGAFAYSPTNGTVLNAGTNTLSVIFIPTDMVDFSSATNAVSLDVSPALLTVTAASVSRAVDQANPVFTGTITGVTNGDDITVTYSCIATTNSPVGSYLIVPSLVDPDNRQTNYIVSLVDGTLTVGEVAPIITWTNPAPIPYGTALSSDQLNATASVPGGFAYTPAIGAALNVGTNTLSVIFIPTDTVDYGSVTDTVSLVVSTVPLTVTAASVSRAFGQANPALTGTIIGVTNGDNITATFGTTATISSPVGTYPIVPSLVDPNNRLTNYGVTLVEGLLTVTQAVPLLTWTNPAPIPYGTALISNQLNATANVPGGFSYTPTNGAALNVGTNALSVIFTPIDSVDYSSVTNTVSLVVSSAPLTVTAASVSRAFGQANPALAGTIIGVTNGDNITATFGTTATTNSSVGSYLIVPSLVDPNDRQTNYMLSLIEGTLTVTQAVPLVTWTTPASITYGTALSSNQLDATANVTGSFAYTPTNGTVLGAGTDKLSVVFTPTDTMDYSSVTNTVNLVVSSAPGTITLYIQLGKNDVILNWNDPTSTFALQAAPAVAGVFTNVTGAASPYTNVITGTEQFFRLTAK